MNKTEDKNYIKSEFDLLKQIMTDLGNINSTLALMNINKFFSSKAVSDSTNRFYDDRKEFVGKLSSSSCSRRGRNE